MGALLISRVSPREPSAETKRALACLEEQGFKPELVARTEDAQVYWAPKLLSACRTLYMPDANNFCLHAGTLFYRGETAAVASHRVLDDLRAGDLRLDELFGSFCVVACIDGALRYFTDPMGTYCMWHDERETLVSSSLPAMMNAAPRLTVDIQGVYEYVFLETTFGGRTLFKEIRRHTTLPSARPSAERRSDEEMLEEIKQVLRRQFETLAQRFGSNIATALSGGYDSRLLLACLRSVGVLPSIYVYGREDDRDVCVARHICESEGWPLQHVDKTRWQVNTDRVKADVRTRALLFEGAFADGIFDSGADIASRLDRGAGGTLTLNGGGGEIFRTFYGFAQARVPLERIVRTFYTRYDSTSCSQLFRPTAFSATLAASMKEAIGTQTDVLDCDDVERLYPYYRCRFWMGPKNSVNNKLTFAVTPFVSHALVTRALRVSARAKRSGRFEARLIQEIGPRLARYPSAYGHSFADPPPWPRLLVDFLNLRRPAWTGQLLFRIRTRKPTPRPAFLRDEVVGQVLDLDFPYMRRFFNVPRVHDHKQYNRLCTLEYLFEFYHARQAE